MSLQFESVSLKNFGPFREVRDLRLHTNPESPIVVIHGENTLGKTRLFRALRWCLYGSPVPGKTAAESTRGLMEYMNRPAAAEGESEMQVAINFVADGQDFRLTRTARFGPGAVTKVSADLRIDSTVIQAASIDAEIGRQLHPQISEFFLFDGELLRDFYDRLNSDRERDLLKESIEAVLGIPALQLADRDIGVMTADVMQRQARATMNQRESEAAQRKLRQVKSRQESLDKDRAEIEAALRKARSDLEDVNERIASVEELKADAREMEMLEAQIRGAEAVQERLRDEMQKLLSRGWLAPASARLSALLELIVERNDAAQARQRDIEDARGRVALLQEQMRGGTCPTCHQELPAPDDATQREMSRAASDLERLVAEAGMGPDLRRERRVRELMDTETITAYAGKQSQLDNLLAEQYERNRRLQNVKDRLKDNDASKIRQLGNEQDRLEQAVTEYSEVLRKLDDEQTKISSQQSKLAGSLRRLGGVDPALAAEAFFFEYVQHLIGRTINRYKERTRLEVEETATAMFMSLIRDPEAYDGIQIGSDYRVDLVGKRGPAMKTSEGGRQLIALSLIGALKQAAVRGGPVVLDSPLARLDLEHRENVLVRWVPQLGSQAILLVQSGELTEEQAREIMGTSIGQAYRILRPYNDPEEAIVERTQ